MGSRWRGIADRGGVVAHAVGAIDFSRRTEALASSKARLRYPRLAMASLDLAQGALLAGKYRLGRELGEGGMARVFEGEHARLGQPVAINVLRDDHAKDPLLVERFEREAAPS